MRCGIQDANRRRSETIEDAGAPRSCVRRCPLDDVRDERVRTENKAGEAGGVLASAANTYWTAALEGAKDIQKKYGNVKITVFDAQFTTSKQLNQLRDALISKKFDAWFMAGPNDGGPLTPTIKQAISRRVKVACTLVPCGPSIRNTGIQIKGQTAFAGIGFYPNGQQLGQLVEQGCRGIKQCKVVYARPARALLEKARTDGLYSIIKDNKNIKVVSCRRAAISPRPRSRRPRTSFRPTPT